jgi:hypothetical protein
MYITTIATTMTAAAIAMTAAVEAATSTRALYHSASIGSNPYPASNSNTTSMMLSVALRTTLTERAPAASNSAARESIATVDSGAASARVPHQVGKFGLFGGHEPSV